MKRRLLVAAAVLCCLAFQPSENAPQNDSIRSEDLRADLFFLAGDAMRGRLTATPENYLAAEFIKSRFERMGLKPAAAEGSFYQAYNLMRSTLGEENLLETTGGDGTQLHLRSAEDWYPQSFSASAQARGSLVFAGFGIVAQDLNYDDYRGQNLKGKIVLVLDHEPGERDPESPFDGVVSAEVSSSLRKALFAQERGAEGILFVRDVHNHSDANNFADAARNYWPRQTPRIDRFTLAAWVERVSIPAAQISPALARVLIRGTGKTLEDFSRSSESARGTEPILISGPGIGLTVNVNRHIVPDRNVLAAIEGTDPNLKDEQVIICAHIDHNGADGAQIFNGADDDGSGIVGLIEIAEAYALAARAGRRPRRSVLFAAWNSEERGLLGAWAYTETPGVRLDKTVAVLNMDMIGRNEEVPEGGGARFRGLDSQTSESNKNAINIIGTTRSPDLKSEVEKANRAFGLELKFRYDNNISQLMRRSDHWPFLQHGVPGLWFHTGLHPDYHTTGDRPERINYSKMERIARMVHQMSWNLAQQNARPRLIQRKKR
jgi:hypothetical protein